MNAIDQIREAPCLYDSTGDIKDINTLLVNRAEYAALQERCEFLKKVARDAQNMATLYSNQHAALQAEVAELRRDADRWRWLKPMYTAANFHPESLDLGDKGVALIFIVPDETIVSSDLDEMTDESIAAQGADHG